MRQVIGYSYMPKTTKTRKKMTDLISLHEILYTRDVIRHKLEHSLILAQKLRTRRRVSSWANLTLVFSLQKKKL